MEYIKRLKETYEKMVFVIGEDQYGYEEGTNRLIELFRLQKQMKQNRTYFIGNGGSAAIAIHMTADFLKNGGMKINMILK